MASEPSRHTKHTPQGNTAVLGSRCQRSPNDGESPNVQPRKRHSGLPENISPNVDKELKLRMVSSPDVFPSKLNFLADHFEPEGCLSTSAAQNALHAVSEDVVCDIFSSKDEKSFACPEQTSSPDVLCSKAVEDRDSAEERSPPRHSQDHSPSPVCSQYRLAQLMTAPSPPVSSSQQIALLYPSNNESEGDVSERSCQNYDPKCEGGNVGIKQGSPSEADTAPHRELDHSSSGDRGCHSAEDGGGHSVGLGAEEAEGLEASRWLSAWQMPVTVCEAYAAAGVAELYQWQVECVESSRVLEDRANLVYSAPTSAGKTLVAEVAAVRCLLERRQRVLFVVPFVSIVLEKVEHFRRLLQDEAATVQGYCSGCLAASTPASDPELSVCTIEKANGILNRLLHEGRLGELGLVVADEAHMIADAARGCLLETLLSKLRFRAPHACQIIALSATVPNIADLARWLHAQLFVTDFRPVPLAEFVVVGRQVLDASGRTVRALGEGGGSDRDEIVELCLEALSSGCSVLVFCASKRACQQCALLLAASFAAPALPCSLEVSERRSRLLHRLADTPTGLDPLLAKTVPRGAAFHHAGLTVEERHCLESAFDQGALSVLAATSTLAAGVNLPAHRVIFRSPYVGPTLLDVGRYRQMSGRAGRAGKDLSGESFVMCEGKDKAAVLRVLGSAMQPVESCLFGEGGGEATVGMRRAVLEAVENRLASTAEEATRFLSCTLYSSLRGPDGVGQGVAQAMEWLAAARMVRAGEGGVVATTHLGKAVVASSMAPHEALAVYEDLKRARVGMALDDELHLIYLNTPVMPLDVPWMRFFDLYNQLGPPCRRIAEMLGVREQFLLKARTSRPEGDGRAPDGRGADGRARAVDIHRRFFAAMMIRELVLESSLQRVSSKFQVPRGVLQQLQTQAAAFAGVVATFCGKLHWWQLEVLCLGFQERLSRDVSADLAPLMQVPSMRSVWARALSAAGVTTAACLASADPSLVADIIRAAMPFASDAQDWEGLQASRMVQGATKLVKTLGIDQTAAQSEQAAAGGWYTHIRTTEELEAAAAEWKRAAAVGVHCHCAQAEGGGGCGRELLGVSLSLAAGSTFYVPTAASELGEAALAAVRRLMDDKTVAKVVPDLKQQSQHLSSTGLTLAGPLQDPLLAMWLLQVKRHTHSTAEDLARAHGVGVPGGGTSDEDRSCVEAASAVRVWPEVQRQLVQHGLDRYLADVEVPTALALGRMEAAGVGVCGAALAAVEHEIREAQREVEAAVERAAGARVELGTSAGLVELLYGTLRIPLPVAAASSGWKARHLARLCSTPALKALSKQHRPAALVLLHRRLSFALSSSVRPLAAALRHGSAGSRVHPRQQLRGCDTGRIAVKGPNLQCLPKPIALQVLSDDSEAEGRQGPEAAAERAVVIRRCVVAGAGRVLVCGDYRQVELRLIAHLSADGGLRRALAGRGDVFRAMAAEWGGVEAGAVTELAREQAKRVCYGLMYGMGVAALAEELEIEAGEAEGLVGRFRETFCGVDALIRRTVRGAQADGFVTTLLGRKRWLPDVVSPNASKRSAAERQAFNTLVQGSAADVLRRALVAVTGAMPAGAGAVVMQVHDELLVEATAEALPQVARMLKERMEGAVQLEVPLEVKLRCGPSWGSLTDWQPE